MFNNKRGIAPIIGILLILIVVIGGYVGYQQYQLYNSENSGTPSPLPQSSPAVTLSPSQTPCPSGQLRDNNGQCVVPPCPAGSSRNNVGECVVAQVTSGGNTQNPGYQPTPQANCKPTGYLKTAYVLGKDVVGWSSDTRKPAPLSYSFVVTNDCDANFYVEGGLLENLNGLTILVTQPSACDGNPHFTGKFITGNKNTQFSPTRPAGEFDVAVFPQDYNKVQKLKLVGGVYTGCVKDGGKSLGEIQPQLIDLRNPNTGGLSAGWTDTDVTLSFKRII